MKITLSRLRKIIREEALKSIIKEEGVPDELERQDPEPEPEVEVEAEEADENAQPTHVIFVSGFEKFGMTSIDIRVINAETRDTEEESRANDIGAATNTIQSLMKKYSAHMLHVDSESASVKALEETQPPEADEK